MSWALANLWNSPVAQEIACDISTISGLYCGPAAIGWIAAVWNNSKGRPYEYQQRLRDKGLFPDGPRPFQLDLPGFQTNLEFILKRETNNELRLSDNTYYRYRTIHDILMKQEMPVIIRMLAPKFIDGLHYVTLYKSEKNNHQSNRDHIQFYWQDNGFYGSNDGVNTGLSKTDRRNAGWNIFLWGAKGVVKV